MWWSKKESPPVAAAASKAEKLQRHGKTTRSRSCQGRDSSNPSLLNTAETNSGFEVHFVNGIQRSTNNSVRKDRRSGKSSGVGDAAGTASKDGSSEASPVISRSLLIEYLMAGRRRVYRSQYASPNLNIEATSPLKQQTPERFVPRPHRVPISIKAKSVVTASPSFSQESLSLLRRHDVSSELQCLEDEIKLLDVEITGLRKDRADFEHYSRRINLHTEKFKQLSAKSIDPHSCLTELQEQRGVCLTLRLGDESCREFLLSECGFKASFLSQFMPKSASPIILTKQNCGEEGPAAWIQHISLLSDDSVFVSLDSAKSFHHGRLPERLFRRIQSNQSMNDNQLIYIATGPMGCYYAEFHSGEVVWGIASDSSEGDDFATLCRDWSIARVAFGPVCVVHDVDGIPHKAASWIILSRNGQVAWKNIPSQLHRFLEDRMSNQAAPVEVSLGYGDSYFIRFLDGTVDYCLPAHIASIIEERKLDVTSISLHAELPNDFILRHH